MKEYICKIFTLSGTYITTWNDASFVGFSKSINSGLGEAVISLARHFDDFGEGEDIKLNNEVQIWLSDNDTPSEGIQIYSGFISAYRPWIDGSQEGVDITLLGYITKLTQDIYRDQYTTLDFVAANNDTVTVADNAAHDVTNALTVECWLKTTTVLNSVGLICHDLSNYKYMLHLANGSKNLQFYVRTASGVKAAIITRDAGWNDGNWHYVVGVWVKPFVRIYVDGKLANSIEGYDENITAGDEGLTIGRFSTNYFNGQMMNVRVSSVVRAPDEISMNWKKGQKLEADSNAFAVFHFDEGTGSAVIDETGTQDGVVNGADWLTAQEARSTINQEDADPSEMLKDIIAKYIANNPNAKIKHLIT